MGTAARKPRRWRWRLALMLLLGLATWLGLRTLLHPERLSAFLLQQASQATGMTFTLAAPAGVGLWPDLHLELEGLTAHAPGVTNAVFRSAQVEIVVPWSALQGDTLQLRSLRLQAPVLDTVALSQWWSSRSQDGPPAPLRLPRFDAAIEITDARLQAAQWAIAGLDASLPFLRTGAAVNLQAGGRIEADTREPIAFSFDLLATPTEIDGGLRLDPMQLELREGPAGFAGTRVEGRVALLPPDRLQLDVLATLPAWPAHWPALPLPATDADSPVRIDLDYSGNARLQGKLAVRLAREDADLAGQMTLGNVLAWLDAPATTPLPPLRGELASDRLDFGGIELRGVRLQIDDTPPAEKGDAR